MTRSLHFCMDCHFYSALYEQRLTKPRKEPQVYQRLAKPRKSKITFTLRRMDRSKPFSSLEATFAFQQPVSAGAFLMLF